MKCMHCGTAFYDDWEYQVVSEFDEFMLEDKYTQIKYTQCPECREMIIFLETGSSLSRYRSNEYEDYMLGSVENSTLIYPKFPNLEELDDAIPEKYRDLYRESAQVNFISPRASATLSRYLLQLILHEEFDIKERNLEQEIDKLQKLPQIPSTMVTYLQVMRRVANFGAHPKKSTNSREIIDVEKGESDIMLELLKELFDFVFVKPKHQRAVFSQIEEKYGIKVDK